MLNVYKYKIHIYLKNFNSQLRKKHPKYQYIITTAADNFLTLFRLLCLVINFKWDYFIHAVFFTGRYISKWINIETYINFNGHREFPL